MNKFLIFLLLFIVSSNSNLYSQSGWQWLNPTPQGMHVQDIEYVMPGIVIAVADNGTILRSTNSGGNWSVYETGFPVLISSVKFINNTTGYITGGGKIGKTTNAGESWQFWEAGYELNDLQVINSSLMFAKDYNYLYKSINGGYNWTRITINYYHTVLNGFYFFNENEGLATGFPDILVRTTDGGNTWINMAEPNISKNYTSLAFSGNIGLMTFKGSNSESETGILRSTNYGLNWVCVNCTTSGDSYTKVKLSGSKALAIYRGDIMSYSNDFGLTWQGFQINSGIYNTFSMCSGAGNDIYTVGRDGYISKTSNFGINWSKIYKKDITGGFYSAKYLTENIIFTGSLSFGVIYKSSDSGLNWNKVNEDTSLGAVNDFIFMNENTGFAFANNAILRTSNGGVN